MLNLVYSFKANLSFDWAMYSMILDNSASANITVLTKRRADTFKTVLFSVHCQSYSGIKALLGIVLNCC